MYDAYEENASEDDFKDEYGDKFKYSIKILKEEEVDNDDFEDICDRLKDYNIDAKKVKKAVDVEYEITIKGNEGEETVEDSDTLVKIGSKWYVMSAITSFCFRAS